MGEVVGSDALDRIFREARTRNGWTSEPVTEDDLRRIYDLAKFGPTSLNTSPARFVFVSSLEGKERLRAHLAPGNVDKTMAAPVCVIIAHDLYFHERLPKLFPARDMQPMFANNASLAEETAVRNAVLQGAYLMIAARSLGFDVGPMSGYNRAALDADFFPDGRWASDFLCNIGHGSDENLFPRNPRLDFDEASVLA